ncbi:hypothetical protein BDM02DRAFT_3184450 [Thelephora ganbajun]|uniref:Uncharacterized protein n=1 Tax=Thelephora ganbajun TaxID=370292 RepID=A0ACB6ZNP5_THEGA|nr:hypothetical protein BDM02DRAFT_3184450 [Thelephora ganbajun]
MSTATLIGFTFETLFYGVFLIIFGVYANLQRGRYRQEPLSFGNKLAFGFSILLCLFITTHWWLNLWGVYEAFLQTSTPLARETILIDFGAIKTLTRGIIYVVQTWMGDALLIYRLYHVAGRRWVAVVLPIIMCCSLIGCNCLYLYYASKLDFTKPQTLPATQSWIKKWTIVGFAITLAENTYCISLITFFVWRTHCEVRQVTSSTLQPVLRIFVESAGVWVFSFFVAFIVYLFDENACFICLYLMNPLLGIAFCTVAIRLQFRNKTAVVGSGNNKLPHLSTFEVASKEHSSHADNSMSAPNKAMVFGSKQAVDESIFDITASKV